MQVTILRQFVKQNNILFGQQLTEIPVLFEVKQWWPPCFVAEATEFNNKKKTQKELIYLPPF